MNRKQALALVALVVSSTAMAQSPFTIAVIPDTQNYSQQSASTPGGPLDFFRTQTQWIVNNQAQHNIVFATHLGDIVNTASSPASANPGSPSAQWNVAVPAMDVLKNSTVPHAILPGNHDWTSSNGTGSLVHYRPRFGDTSGFYTGKPWFLGYDPVRGANSAQRFSTPVGDMLHFSLEWNASNPATSSDRPSATGNALAWVQSVIDAHPGVPTIISTHNHVTPNGVRDAAGQGLFDSIIANNPQVFLVLNGHYIGENRIASTNARGQAVYEMLADYQGRPRGGDGWMRLLTFDPANQALNVRTYTPVSSGVSTTASGVGPTAPAGAAFGNVGLLEVDDNSQFSLPLDFNTRFARPIATTELTFRNGVAGYNSTQDTYLSGDAPDTNYGNVDGLWIDVVGVSQPNQALIRFDSAIEQVTDLQDIVSARIRVKVTGSNSAGSGFLVHRMLEPWTESSTWNSLVNGISADGLEALAQATSQYGANADVVGVREGYLEIDITRDARAWFNGATNHGVALLPFVNGVNGVRVASSENAILTDRPQLVLDLTAQPVNTVSFQNQPGGYSGTQDTELRQGNRQQNAVMGANVHLHVDDRMGAVAPGKTQALLRFDDLFGDDQSQIPTDARVVSATLKLHVNDAGSGLALYRMRSAWDERSTWSSMGDGVQIGSETMPFPEALAGFESSLVGVDSGMLYFDVTASVMNWQLDPDSNLGWLLTPQPGATDGIRIDSSEAIGVGTVRPELVVRFIPGLVASLVPEPAMMSMVAASSVLLMRRRVNRAA